jgi:hypothetical protein
LVQPTITISSTLDLNCLLLSHHASHIFPIEIAGHKTISALRKVIKDEKGHVFHHIDTDTCILWNISIPVTQSLTENLNKFNFVDEGRLSKVFWDQSEDEHRHIIM